MNSREKGFLLLSSHLGDSHRRPLTVPQLRELERVVLLKMIDRRWMDHIDNMEQLRQSIGLQAYGQRNPVIEYTNSGFEMFGDTSDYTNLSLESV